MTVLSASLILAPYPVLRILLSLNWFSPERPSWVCSGSSVPRYVYRPSVAVNKQKNSPGVTSQIKEVASHIKNVANEKQQVRSREKLVADNS